MEQTFILTNDHITLLSNSVIVWNSGFNIYGAACVNAYKPYGSDNILNDIYELIEGEKIDEEKLMREMKMDYDVLSTVLYKKYQAIHRGTETALQIALHTKSFEPGEYRLESSKWIKLN